MEYPGDAFHTFLDLETCNLQSMGRSQASRFLSKYLKLRSEDEQSFYRFGTTWGKVKNSNFGVE